MFFLCGSRGAEQVADAAMSQAAVSDLTEKCFMRALEICDRPSGGAKSVLHLGTPTKQLFL